MFTAARTPADQTLISWVRPEDALSRGGALRVERGTCVLARYPPRAGPGIQGQLASMVAAHSTRVLPKVISAEPSAKSSGWA
jgi:hypothetical protein